MKCNLSGCLEPIEFKSISENKDVSLISYYCKYDYPEAWDLEGLGYTVKVFRISDNKKMKERDRIYSKNHRYKHQPTNIIKGNEGLQ